ncbi:hypothetical protein NBRC10512_001999 [Rhodotorula toruloides]|uniref:RHTO0S03e10594g1_1 n=2 Tax=Rhodotorula toruloides TaxID=5286 RepID=A0A061ALT8_RHOTO|nr:aspartic-type endopeptidase [Rhodotorula toruloides NP11]EMS26074.1 aspartic-type endopeptidase [Rhodotorula toruloides NP11]CDR38538.1 RHTO0S03e10594g1_1 [Rhodotorula toruloides]
MLFSLPAVVLALGTAAGLVDAAPSPPRPLTIELTKRDLRLKNDDGSVNIAGLQAQTVALTHKYNRNRNNYRYHALGEGKNPESRMAREKRASAGTIQLTEQSMSVWTGKVYVGTPAVPFNIYFDTGSSDFTIASIACGTSCGTKQRYNYTASSTAVKTTRTVTTNFVDGTSSSGTLYTDTVTIAGVTANQQALVAASSLSSTVADIASDGLMGLAFSSLSGAYTSSFMFTVNSQGTAAYPYFSMRLNNNGPSEMTFGAFNRLRSASGNPRWYQLATDSGTYTYWQFGMAAPWVNNKTALSTPTNHIIDSGTTLIVAPPSSAAEFWSHVPGSAVYNSNFWTFPCASPPQVDFAFSRITLQRWGVSQDSFNLGYLAEDPTRCVGAVIGQNLGLGSSWILGDAFLTNVYVVHDVANKRIGLAIPR